MNEKLATKFELNVSPRQPEMTHESSAAVLLSLAGTAMKFARVERVPRYEDGRRESDAEHSFMLALTATELAARHFPELNPGLVSQYATVHDLIELKTGDVATFQCTEQELAEKAAREHEALESLLKELPPYTASLLERYETQADPEARFVKAVDKNLPLAVDILGDGVRVMREDYGVKRKQQLVHAHDKLRRRMTERFSEFPQVVEDHDLLCELFEMEFEAVTERRLSR